MLQAGKPLGSDIFLKKMGTDLHKTESRHTFAPAFEKERSMTRGVTVAQQILVLFVRVRILAGQQKK